MATSLLLLPSLSDVQSHGFKYTCHGSPKYPHPAVSLDLKTHMSNGLLIVTA